MQATANHTEERPSRRSQYAAHRRREIAYGRWRPRRDAGAVRAHVVALRAAGMTLDDISAASGARGGHQVSVSTLKALVNGRGAGTQPTRQVSRDVAAALLSVEPATARVAMMRAVRRACALPAEPSWHRRELRRLAESPAGSQNDAALSRLLQRAVEDAVRDRCVGVSGADLRVAAAAHVLRSVFPQTPGVQERRAAVRALCGPAVGLSRATVARLLGVGETTVRRDLS